MYRCSVLVLCLFLALPVLTEAQEQPTLPRSRISITPFAGYRIGYTARGQLVATSESGSDIVDIEETRGGGAILGGQLEIRTIGPISVIGAVAYGRPGEIRIPAIDPDNPAVAAPSVWFAKAGLSFRLPDPVPDSRSFHPAAFITIAPGVMREEFDPWPTTAEAERMDHFTLSIGGEAVTAIGTPWIALNLGVEDVITFWKRTRREEIVGEELSELFEQPVTAEFDYDPSHILLLRAGLSLRFF